MSKRNAAPEVVIADETTVRPATAEELANNMDYQETMYNRYKYNIRKVYKVNIIDKEEGWIVYWREIVVNLREHGRLGKGIADFQSTFPAVYLCF